MAIFDRLGETITVLRMLRRLSQTELAERSGIQSNQISRYEKGMVQPQLGQLERILGALDVGLAEFFFALHHLDRTARLLEEREFLPEEEALVRNAVVAYWENVTDLHLRISRQAMQAVTENLRANGGDEAKTG